jgi:hypothetical protein
VKWSLTFEASTSVAICDESPLLQSIGPTVIKKKRYWSLINKDEWKLNYPLFPAHKRSAPTRPPRRTRQWTKPSPDEKKKKKKKKKNLPATILTNEIYYLSLTRKQICLFATAVTSSVNFFYTFCKINFSKQTSG